MGTSTDFMKNSIDDPILYKQIYQLGGGWHWLLEGQDGDKYAISIKIPKIILN